MPSCVEVCVWFWYACYWIAHKIRFTIAFLGYFIICGHSYRDSVVAALMDEVVTIRKGRRDQKKDQG